MLNSKKHNFYDWSVNRRNLGLRYCSGNTLHWRRLTISHKGLDWSIINASSRMLHWHAWQGGMMKLTGLASCLSGLLHVPFRHTIWTSSTSLRIGPPTHQRNLLMQRLRLSGVSSGEWEIQRSSYLDWQLFLLNIKNPQILQLILKNPQILQLIRQTQVRFPSKNDPLTNQKALTCWSKRF